MYMTLLWYYDTGMTVKKVLLECSRVTEMDYTIALVWQKHVAKQQ